MREPRARGEAELRLDVLLVVEEHAPGGVAVAPGAPRLLQVALERAGDVGVQDDADVRFVDAHAEGVRRNDDAQRIADELLLDLALRAGLHPGVEERARPAGVRDVFGQDLGVPAGRGEHDRPARVAGELAPQDLEDPGGLFRLGRRDHLVGEVRPLVTPDERRELDPELGLEVLAEIGDHVRLRGRGETSDPRRRVREALADEPRDVQVVGAEVVAPLRQAMGLVEHPGRDLPAGERGGEAPVPELLRGHEHDARLAELDLPQHLPPFGRRQQPVQRDGGVDALADQVVDLVLHQGLERRNDDGQLAAAPVVCERRDLIAERLAGAGRQDRDETLAAEARDDDVPLERAAGGVRRRRAERGLVEVVREQRFGMVMPPAVAARGIVARHLAELVNEPGHVLERTVYPRRQHRVAAGDAQPGDDVGKRGVETRVAKIFGSELGEARPADRVRERSPERVSGFVPGRTRCAADRFEHRAQTARRVAGQEEVEQGDVVGARLRKRAEGGLLVEEEREGKLGVPQRVVARVADELVVLDEPVVRVLRKGERRELERVHHRQAEEREAGVELAEDCEIVPANVVTEDEGGAVRQVV